MGVEQGYNPELAAIDAEFETLKDKPNALLLKTVELSKNGKWDAVQRLQELADKYYAKAA